MHGTDGGHAAHPAVPTGAVTTAVEDPLPPELEDVLPPEVLAAMAADLAAFNAAVAVGAVEPGPEPWDAEWTDRAAGGQPSTVWDLSTMSPAEVVGVLPEVDLDQLDERDLLEVAAAWQRVASYATAHAANAAGALAERDAMNPPWPEVAGTVAQPCIATDELALRLGWSRPMAGRLVAEGLAYRQALAWTGEALAAGAICPAKARVMVTGLADQPMDVALAVQEEVLDDAQTLTPAQLGRRVAAAVLRIDPASARSRHEAARSRRRLDAPRLLPDGMAGVYAVVDAADAVRMDNGIDALARRMRAAGDPRTLDQLRADLLMDVTLGRLCPGGRSKGEDQAESAAEQDTATDAASGHARGADADAAGRGDTACPPVTDLGSLPQRAVIHVTVPLSTLLGTSDEPADLTGYGPIDADTARALAVGGVMRRIVTDPLDGTVLDVGRTRYRAPTAIAEHVTTRDRTCVSPSCSARATRCDLDHTVPFDDGGPTADHNLDPLCRRDHLLKTHAGFHLEQPAPGEFRLRTPTGQVFDVTPGRDVVRRHDPSPPWGGPPPF